MEKEIIPESGEESIVKSEIKSEEEEVQFLGSKFETPFEAVKYENVNLERMLEIQRIQYAVDAEEKDKHISDLLAKIKVIETDSWNTVDKANKEISWGRSDLVRVLSENDCLKQSNKEICEVVIKQQRYQIEELWGKSINLKRT